MLIYWTLFRELRMYWIFFSVMQLGTFGSFTMMYGEENDSNCQRCTFNFSFMVPLVYSLVCKIALREVAKKSDTEQHHNFVSLLYHLFTWVRCSSVLFERLDNWIWLLSLCIHVHFWETPAIVEKILFILPAILVASGGTKIVLCLLPRLQHWQHDVAIYSQYCISMAFCEKVAANLSPQSAACQCEEGSSRGTGWGELGQLCPSTLHPVPLVNGPSSPRCHPRASL